MSKSAINFLVDAVALAAIMLLGATGVLIRYVLPPGSGHFSQLWGMDRHQWGQIHLWIAVALLSTVVLHLFLHWHWVVCTVKGRPDRGESIRVSLAIVSVLVCRISSFHKTGGSAWQTCSRWRTFKRS